MNANDEHLTVWPDTVRHLSIKEVTDDDGDVIGHDATAEIWPGNVYRFQWRESFPTWCRVREIAPNPTETTPTTQTRKKNPMTNEPTTDATAATIARIMNDGLSVDGWDTGIMENIAEYLQNAHGIELDDASDR